MINCLHVHYPFGSIMPKQAVNKVANNKQNINTKKGFTVSLKTNSAEVV